MEQFMVVQLQWGLPGGVPLSHSMAWPFSPLRRLLLPAGTPS